MQRFALSVILCLMGLVLLSAIQGLRAWQIPRDVRMQAAQNATGDPAYAPVDFPHQTHLAVGTCHTCHHKWVDKSKAPAGCAAQGCHHVLGATGQAMRSPESAYFAYHARKSDKSCIGCHRDLQDGEQPAGPVACTRCHARTDRQQVPGNGPAS
jgi:hypothetical protein